jgi:hypothetical protein
MSLGRLLTTGKAFITPRDLPSPYRMRREALLPKFGGDHNPFMAEPAVSAAVDLAKTGTARPPETAPRRGLWLWKWNLKWFGFGGRKSASVASQPRVRSKAGPPRQARAPVQGELSLDKVKVVRNDLSESDADAVARGNGAAAARSPAASNLLWGAMAAGKALDRLAERIVGAGPR